MCKARNEKELNNFIVVEFWRNKIRKIKNLDGTNIIIATKDKLPHMFIPKILKDVHFSFNKISKEDEKSIEAWKQKFNTGIVFYVVWIEEVIYLIPYEVVQKFKKNGQTKMTFVEIIDNSILFEDFLEV